MNTKTYICFYIFIFVCIQKVSLSFSEDKTDNFKSKDEQISSKNGIKTYSDSESTIFGKIEGSDFFETKENLQKNNNNSNPKKWTIKINLGPFNSKDDVLKILSNIRTDSSGKLFKFNAELPKANLNGNVINFKFEDSTSAFKTKGELIFSTNGINTYSDPDSMSFGLIEESDFFETKENLQKNNNNSNAKKWTITINLGPFNTKNDALKIPSNLRTDSSKIIFEPKVGLPKANLYEKVLNFKIAEVESSKKPDKNITKNNFENKHVKKYDKHSAPINSNYMIEIKTDGLPLRVRESPTTKSPIIYRLKNGSTFITLDKPKYDETEGWVRIEYLNGKFGWISKTYSKIIDLLEPEFIAYKSIESKPSLTIENFNAEVDSSKIESEFIDNKLAELKPSPSIEKLNTEVDSSKKFDEKQIQNNLKNKNLKSYEKQSVPINSNYIIKIKTNGLSLRIRESPTTKSPIIYRLKNGSTFISADKPRYDETGGWVRIEYLKGEFGWISKTYSKITDSVESKFIDNKFTELKPSPSTDNFNIDQVNNWIEAWENKNFKFYLSFYSNNFKGNKEFRQSWEESREHALKKYLTIDIEAKSIHITRSGNNIKVSFIQFFKSDKFSDIGKKVLYWEKQETGWKIVKELWSPL
jgi:hypothetical protein